MNVVLSMFILISTIFMSACSTSLTPIPERFAQNTQISSDGGYTIESKDANGFYMETFYRKYNFWENIEDSHLQEAKDYFIRIALVLANDDNQKIQSILKSQLITNSNRNVITGINSIYVSGRVKYNH